jgi:hypothetical protein
MHFRNSATRSTSSCPIAHSEPEVLHLGARASPDPHFAGGWRARRLPVTAARDHRVVDTVPSSWCYAVPEVWLTSSRPTANRRTRYPRYGGPARARQWARLQIKAGQHANTGVRPSMLRALSLRTNTGSLVDGVHTASLVRASARALLTAGLTRPSASPECCIAWAEGQPPPRRSSVARHIPMQSPDAA